MLFQLVLDAVDAFNRYDMLENVGPDDQSLHGLATVRKVSCNDAWSLDRPHQSLLKLLEQSLRVSP
jgi:hypothetical protein